LHSRLAWTKSRPTYYFSTAGCIDVRCYSAFLPCCIVKLMNQAPPWSTPVSPMDSVICCLANFMLLLPYVQTIASLCSLLQFCLDMVAVEMPMSRLFCMSVRWSGSTLFWVDPLC
jgi:hypothetical protein